VNEDNCEKLYGVMYSLTWLLWFIGWVAVFGKTSVPA